MGFYYAAEKAKFDKNWEITRKTYISAGMDEISITEMHEYDWNWFGANRTYSSHTQDLPSEILSSNEEINSKLFMKYESLRVPFDECGGTLHWIESIDRVVLVDKLKQLHAEDMELLTLIVKEGYSQAEIACMKGCSKNAISKRILRIRKKF